MISWLFDAHLTIAGHEILWREIIGNLFGLASAIGGMRRKVWAWPVGIVGNVLLFTVFLGAFFNPGADTPNLWGQAGRQVFFVVVAIYGWYRWSETKREGGGEAVVPHWATWKQRIGLILVAGTGTLACALLFEQLNSYGPWLEAWIFVGSMLATYGMARGWTEFWLIWIAVDAVGVPQLISAGYYPSAVLYMVYAVVVIVGFVTWLRIGQREHVEARPVPGHAKPSA